MPHIFFSYAHADAPRLYPVHARMQAAVEHNLWIDKIGLRTGVEWEKAIKRAVDESYAVIFAITPAFNASGFIPNKEIPWTIDAFKDKQGKQIFLLLFDDVPLLPVLQNALADERTKYVFHTIDARDGDEKRLFAELKAVLPPAPKEKDRRFLVDWPRLLTFQGRDNQLVDLHDRLMGGGNVSVSALHGLGGIGKTQLAVEYAHRYRFHYAAGVYWINAARPDWTGEIAEIARNLGLTPAETGESSVDRALAAAFNNFLRAQPDDAEALVILDNVENPADVTNREVGPRLRLNTLPARLLVTTRRADLPAGFSGVAVNVLPLEDARAVLLAARPDAAHDPAIDAICHALGRLPLALGVAAAALKKRDTISPARFLDYLREQGVDAIAKKLKLTPGELGTPADYNFLLDAALGWHWVKIGADAQNIMALAAAYGEAAELHLNRLRILSALPDDPDDLDQPFSDAIRDLRAASLIEDAGERAIRLHPLVRDYARRALPNYPARLAEAAWFLANAYRTPQTLVDETSARGFGALIADLRDTESALRAHVAPPADTPPDETARVGLVPDVPALESIKQLAQLFDWEGHHLRNLSQPAAQSPSPRSGEGFGEGSAVYLIQSIRERVHHQGRDRVLRDDCDRWLTPYFHFHTEDAYRFPHDPALVRIFEGHTSGVNAVVLLPDGRHALSGSYDKTLRLWELATGAEVRRFEGHIGQINAVAVPDGRHALSGSYDRTLRLWELTTGAEVQRFEGHTSEIKVVAVTPDGRHALSGSGDKTLRLWELATGREVRRFEGRTGQISAVAVLPDGRHALSGSGDKTLRLWELATGREVRRFEGHAGQISAVAVLPDGRHALSGSGDKTLRLWELETGAEVRRFEGHTGQISAVVVLPDGRYVLSASSNLFGSAEKTLRLWELETGAEVQRFEGHAGQINAVVVLADGRHALSGSGDKTLRLWELGTGAEVRRFEGHTGQISAVAVTPDGRHALSASGSLLSSADKTLRLWELETGAEVRRFEGHTGQINAVIVTLDGRHALSGSRDKTLRLWELETGAEVRHFEGHTSEIKVVAVTPDGRHALSGAYDSTLRLWELETGAEVRRFEGHAGQINAVAVTPDGRYVLSASGRVVGSTDNTLRLCELATSVEVWRFKGHTGQINAVAVTPDGRHALSGSGDRTLRLCELETGAEVQRFEGHTGQISAAVVTPDGRHILSGAWDKTLRVWDIRTGVCLSLLRLAEGPTRLALVPETLTPNPSPSGRGEKSLRVFVGDERGGVRVVRVLWPGS